MDDTADIIHEWVSVEEAAIVLGVSTRTIARKVKSGDLESRVGEDGRRMVLVGRRKAAEKPSDACQPSDVGQANDTSVNTTDIVLSQLSPIIRTLEETGLHAQVEVRRARAAARTGWLLAAGLIGLLVLGTGVCAWMISRSRADLGHLTTQVHQWQTAADGKSSELSQLRQDLEAARMAQARAEGELTATKAVLAAKPTPTTRPSAWRAVADALVADR